MNCKDLCCRARQERHISLLFPLMRHHTTKEHRQKLKKEKSPGGSSQKEKENVRQSKRWTKANEKQAVFNGWQNSNKIMQKKKRERGSLKKQKQGRDPYPLHAIISHVFFIAGECGVTGPKEALQTGLLNSAGHVGSAETALDSHHGPCPRKPTRRDNEPLSTNFYDTSGR